MFIKKIFIKILPNIKYRLYIYLYNLINIKNKKIIYIIYIIFLNRFDYALIILLNWNFHFL